MSVPLIRAGSQRAASCGSDGPIVGGSRRGTSTPGISERTTPSLTGGNTVGSIGCGRYSSTPRASSAIFGRPASQRRCSGVWRRSMMRFSSRAWRSSSQRIGPSERTGTKGRDSFSMSSWVSARPTGCSLANNPRTRSNRPRRCRTRSSRVCGVSPFGISSLVLLDCWPYSEESKRTNGGSCASPRPHRLCSRVGDRQFLREARAERASAG